MREAGSFQQGNTVMALRNTGVAGVWMVAALVAGCGGGSGGDSGTTATTTTPIATTTTTNCASSLGAGDLQVEPLRYDGSGTVAALQARAALQVPVSSISLGALSEARLAAAETARSQQGVPLQVGVARALIQSASVAGTAALLDWQTTAAGGKVAAISVSADAAKGLRLGLLVRSLPAQATLRVYAQGSGSAYVLAAVDVLAALARNVAAGDNSDAAHTYWTPLVEGAEVTLEIELPAAVGTDAVQIAIPSLSHQFLALSGDDNLARAAAGSCEVNTACNSSYNQESNAVARIHFVSGGAGYWCSGTLLNDSAGSGTPYFLTANHCIATQTEASTLQPYWFDRTSTCSATTSSTTTATLPGATLLYHSGTTDSVYTDTSFLRLTNLPPSGAVFAGWSTATPTLGAAAASLHQPQGGVQKISTGSISSFRNCTSLDSTGGFTCTSGGATSGTLNATFTSGATESGSSGGALFQTIGSGHYLVGQLYGGNSSCTATTGSNIYGRLDIAYAAALGQWLGAASSTTVLCEK
jgi:lysyl endopeptidase